MRDVLNSRRFRGGFTIVELLIVVVVIAILAAVTIVAYNGIQDRAKLSVLKSTLSSAARAMEAGKARSSTEDYPTSLDEAGLKSTNSVNLQLSVDNSANPKTFCITAVDTTKVGVAYHIVQGSNVLDGQCAGHTTNPGFTNLIANPGFESGGSLVTTRTNLFLNPRQVAGAGIGAGLVATTGLNNFGGFTTGSTGVADSAWKSFYLNSAMPATGTATPVAMRFWVQTNQSSWIIQNLSSNTALIASWGGVLTRLDTNQQVNDFVADNVPREYSFTFTVPASQTAGWSFGFKHGSSTPDANKSITVTGILAETSTTVGTYFDGTTASHDGVSYTWSGTANNSTSFEQGAVVSKYGSNRVVGVQSTSWTGLGSYSMMQIPQSVSSNDNYTELIGGAGSSLPISTLKPSTLYTLMATVHIESPLTGLLAGNGSRSLFVHLNGTGIALSGVSQAPNTSGTYDLRVTFTTPASFSGYNTMRLYHGGYAGSGVLWWDKIGLVEGNYSGSYFE